MAFKDPGPATSTSMQWRLAVMYGAALMMALAFCAYFMPLYVDDAFISYRYADRLLDGQGLTWNDGEHVEGYSNLLWVLLIAAGGLFTRDLIVVGWVLGLFANAASLAALTWAFRREAERTPFAVFAGLVTMSLSSAFAYWGVGGLEMAFLCALIAWALAVAYRMSVEGGRWVLLGVLLGLIAITRPDGIVFAAGVAGGLVLRAGLQRKIFLRAIGIALIAAAFFAAQLLFRISYYGDVVPNTAYAKVTFSIERVWLGIRYVFHGLSVNAVLVVAMALAAAWLARMRHWTALREALLFVVPAALWLTYLASVGGDMFPYLRLWLPALICFSFALVRLLSGLPTTTWRPAAATLAVAMVAHFSTQHWVRAGRSPSAGSKADTLVLTKYKEFAPDAAMRPLAAARRDMETCMTMGRFLNRAFREEQPLLAVNYAGCMPYSSKLPGLDMLGLTDAYIARNRPRDMGQGRLGHELGDGAYVLSRAPDLVAFCVPATGADEPCLRSETEMARTAEFRRDYRLIFYRDAGVDAALWTRIEQGRIGIQRSRDRIRIPGYLMATRPGVRAVLDPEHGLVAALASGEAAIENVYLPPGRWTLSLETIGDTQLRLDALPESDVTRLSDSTVQVVSMGTRKSFKVSGGAGEVRALVADQVARYSSN